MSHALARLQNIPLTSALNWAVGTGLAEIAIKSRLKTICGFLGNAPTRVLHELSDYPQSVMAGVIALRYLGFGRPGYIALSTFVCVPLICKTLSLFNRGVPLSRGADHAVRIAGKMINFVTAASQLWRKPEIKAEHLGQFFRAWFLFAEMGADIQNTKMYLSNRVNINHIARWNYHNFLGKYLDNYR